MRIINELIKDTNIYINAHPTDMDVAGLERVARWVTQMVGIFGLDANASAPYNGLGWARPISESKVEAKELLAPYIKVYTKIKDQVLALSSSLDSPQLNKLLEQEIDVEASAITESSDRDPEHLALPYLRNISQVRDELRRIAPASSSKKDILQLCDQIRDTDLTNIGVYLDDRDGGRGSLIKFIPASELLAAQAAKNAALGEKAAQKEALRLAKEKAEMERAEKAKVSPREMFKDERYSAWDEEGMPTKLANGDEVTKSAFKKLRKDWERQKKIHDEWKLKQS